MKANDRWSLEKRVTYLTKMLIRLRERRRSMMREARHVGRPACTVLNAKLRDEVLAKTDGRCHICGGKVGADWHADHVLAHASGGVHAADNYLPAHALCNNYRWHYLSEEFQYVMKIGVWARRQIEKGTPLGRDIARGFAIHERRREERRKPAA